MPAVCQRMAARENGVALSTAVITENTVDVDHRANNIAKEIDDAYAELAEQRLAEIDSTYDELAEHRASEDELTDFTGVLEIMGIDPEELILGKVYDLPRAIRPHRRPNPRARSMRHKGCKYVIRKDRHTKAFYKEIEAIQAEIEANKQSRRTVRRRVRKNAEASGNPRRYKASH